MTGVTGNCVYKTTVNAKAITVEVKTDDVSSASARSVTLTADAGTTITPNSIPNGFSLSGNVVTIAANTAVNGQVVKVNVLGDGLASTVWTITFQAQSSAVEEPEPTP